MLWDPGSVEKDGEEEQDSSSVSPILVPLQDKSSTLDTGESVVAPDVQELKDQFQQQQNMLTQIKETLIQNESQLSSKGKQVEAYANKLSQIRARSKNTQGKKSSAVGNQTASQTKSLTKKSSKENLTKIDNQETEKPVEKTSKTNRRGKISELKKCLEENKLKFEERTGKEQSETKKIESLVEQLKMQLEERDKTIQDLQKNIEEPSVKNDSLQDEVKPKFEKKGFAPSKTTQTNRSQTIEESNEIKALQNKIHELEANVLDLEENLKEKESVIKARTQAVTLLSQDLSLKGKNTLESLEETRQEMRTMQSNFIAIEDHLKRDLSDRDNRLILLEERCKKLESTNFDLSLKNAEQQEKLVKLQELYLKAENEKKLLKETASQGHLGGDDKMEELAKRLNALTKELDDRNKGMIRMKIEHKNQLKHLNKTIDTLKGSSDDKAEIVRLSTSIQDLVNAKTTLENRVAELEDEKVTEKKLKDQINELEMTIKRQGEDLSRHLETISNLKKDKSDLIQSIEEKSAVIKDLESKFSQRLDSDRLEEGDQGLKLKALSKRLENLEAEHNRKMEDLKSEHRKEIEMLESYYNGKLDGLDRKDLEEYRISTEISNIHIEEQIELLKCEKQQLLEKLKSLLGVSSTDSLTFEKMEYSDLRDDKEEEFKRTAPQLGVEVDLNIERDGENRISHLQRIVNDQQQVINDLQKTVSDEKQKASTYCQKITELEGMVKHLEDVNLAFRQQIEKSEPAETGKAQKSNVNAKNRLKKIEMELIQSKKTLQEQSEKLKDLNLKLEEKEELIKKYTEKIELFEKDDWDRQNHWQNAEDDLESVQELQKKCLSLENSLIELNEDCERLRKENIEVVHLLSEEKVKRKKLLEELNAKRETKPSEIERRLEALLKVLKDLERKVEKLESSHSEELEEWQRERIESSEMLNDLQGKLEWTNVVITSKETEIFRLQNLLEDRCKQIENLESDLASYQSNMAEREKRHNEMMEELKSKDNQLEEISGNFDKLQQCVDMANEKTATNESQLKELVATVKEMEGDVFKKETELQEIKGILAEKNLDITNLRNRLEEVNSDLTYSYQEHLENMGKCLRDKESDYNALLAEKIFLEDLNRSLVKEKEEIYNQKVELINENGKLKEVLAAKEQLVEEMKAKLSEVSSKGESESNAKIQEMEELKIKTKKLAANLKKKIQIETDLVKQIKHLEELVLGKDKDIEKLETDVKEVTEKWTIERSEKEEIRKELSEALAGKSCLEQEAFTLKERVMSLEKELQESKRAYESQVIELNTLIQRLNDEARALQTKELQYRDYIAQTEAKVSELSQLYQNADAITKGNQMELDEERKSKEVALQKLGEMTGQYEKVKFERDQLMLEKSEVDRRLEEVEKSRESSASEKSGLEAKLQENLAVIDSLETELKKTQDRLKSAEEKFFNAEERRLSLESKNEEMCKKIMEDSENMVTIDDLANRIDGLLKSEKYLNDCVKNLETGNSELQQNLEEAQAQKYNFEMELKVSADKLTELSKELATLRESELEKSGLISELSKELEKLKAENRQITEEFEKLNRDYEQFEIDFKENLENSQNVEMSLKHRIEELTNENAGLQERCNLLSEERSQGEEKKEEEEGEEKKRKKRKSVTFRTDEVEYIKDLKSQLHSYDDSLKQANEEIENLKVELLREKLKTEVSNVVVEAQEKVESLRSTPEKRLSIEASEPIIEKSEWSRLEAQKSSSGERKFDANMFFGGGESIEEPFFNQGAQEVKTRPEDDQQPNSDFDSLMWDDCWGTDGHLEEEYLSQKVVEPLETPRNDAEKRIESLETEMDEVKAENERLTKELQEATTKYTKALKKLKEQKLISDKLQTEVSKLKNNSGFGDLEAALVDELKSQIEAMETKEKELLKYLENAKLEKEALLKRIDVLNAGNEKFLEMKERQDNEVEVWQMKNKELLKEISILRQQVKEPEIPDDRVLAKENIELKNKVEALEWKLCEMNESLEEKQELLEGKGEKSSDVEKVMEEKSILQREIDELNNVKERLEKKLFDEEKKNSIAMGELNEQLTALATENETLQGILGEMKAASEAAKKDDKPNESKIFDYFKSSPADDLFPVSSQQKEEDKAKEAEVEGLKQRISHLEESSRLREEGATREMDALRSKIAELETWLQMKEEEVKNVWQKISEQEALVNMKEEEINNIRQKGIEVDSLKQNLVELEGMLRLRNSELTQLGAVNVEKMKEVEDLRQRLAQIQREKETGTVELNQRILDLENLLRSRQEDSNRLVQETETLKQRIVELESSSSKIKDEDSSQFETIDLNQESNDNFFRSDSEIEALRQKIYELETILRLREEELRKFETNFMPEKESELEALRQSLFQTENILRLREEEINKLQSSSNRNQDATVELDELRRKVRDLEEFLRFKENEAYELQSLKATEIQNLNQKIFELENLVKTGSGGSNQYEQNRLFELENMIRFKEEEVENLRQKIQELEHIQSLKNEEIATLQTRLNELEKSYNDSKLEIERLLNEEKLNTEEKFVEPFQKNIQIPVAFEVEALSRTLNEEKEKFENLKYEVGEKDNLLLAKDEEIKNLKERVVVLENKLKEITEEEKQQEIMKDQVFRGKVQLEQLTVDLETELENVKLQLSVTQTELQELRQMKEEEVMRLKARVAELEEVIEVKVSEIQGLREEFKEKVKSYEEWTERWKKEEGLEKEKVISLEKSKRHLEEEVEILKLHLAEKEEDISSLGEMLNEDRSQLVRLSQVLEMRENEVDDLKKTLIHLQSEITQFRNFEKQVKELRATQMRELGSNVPADSDDNPDLSDWTEQELIELSTKLQSDLDSALYMLHQRDVRCDELTFELMQLLEERDTLQLRLSTALRMNEELRSADKAGNPSSSHSLQENKDLVDQSNDRQTVRSNPPNEDLRQLSNKISELHSVNYLRDKTVKDESLQRHKEQMSLLSRISDSDMPLSRDAQSSSNWARGKAVPKVMHI